MEVLVQHGDSYSTGTNNYQIYHGRMKGADGDDIDRLEFLPWGMDNTFTYDTRNFWQGVMQQKDWPDAVSSKGERVS